MTRVKALLRRDWDATASRFLVWSWERLAVAVGVVVIGLAVVSVAAQIAMVTR